MDCGWGRWFVVSQGCSLGGVGCCDMDVGFSLVASARFDFPLTGCGFGCLW